MPDRCLVDRPSAFTGRGGVSAFAHAQKCAAEWLSHYKQPTSDSMRFDIRVVGQRGPYCERSSGRWRCSARNSVWYLGEV